MSNIHKVWGERRRILLTKNSEIDLLYLEKNTFCSTHKHKHKINRFVVISGKVRIESEFGKKILTKNEGFEVKTPIIHRFYALEDSVMIELAYTIGTKIDPYDILRFSQGGRFINGKEYTEDEMRKKGMLDL